MTRFWNLKKDAEIPEDGVLDIDGEIVAESGWWMPEEGVCVARNFRKALKGVKNVTVHINSPGGDVMAGAEIYSALREHSLNGEGRVKVIVTGLAASAASVVAMAGDEILMHPVAYMMIHNPWTFAMGDAKELRKTAKVLDVISEGLISAYEQRTGKDREELKRMLENETWMSAGTAVEEGFADGIFGAEAGAAASAVKPTLMSAKAHGLQEILQRIKAEDPEEKPDEEDPEEEEEEKPKDPDEDPEEDPDEEEAKRAAIKERAELAAAALAAAGY
jgi:ATP-dependent Clp protease protease subunit